MVDFQHFSVWNQAFNFKLSSRIAPSVWIVAFSVVRPGQLLLFGGAFVLQFFLFGNVRSSRNAKWQRYFDFQVTSTLTSLVIWVASALHNQEQRFCGPGERHVRARQELPERPSWPSLLFILWFAFHLFRHRRISCKICRLQASKRWRAFWRPQIALSGQNRSKTASCGARHDCPETFDTRPRKPLLNRETIVQFFENGAPCKELVTWEPKTRPPETWDLPKPAVTCVRDLLGILIYILPAV